MKNRLYIRKIEGSYVLHRIKNNILTIEGDSELVIGGIEPFYKLSKKNCDELFGVINLQQLEHDYTHKHLKSLSQEDYERYICFAKADAEIFMEGVHQGLELCKDKMFTKEDMIKAFELGYDAGADTYMMETKTKEFEMYVKQPKEIDVEIEMEDEFIFDPAMGISQGHYLKTPKLDDDGCIILKRVL